MHGVVLVLVLGQTQVLQLLIWRGFGQPVQVVVPVFRSTQVAVNLGDVAGLVVLVVAAHQQFSGHVLHFNGQRPLQDLQADCLGGARLVIFQYTLGKKGAFAKSS